MPKHTNQTNDEWQNEMHERLGKMFESDDTKLGMILTMLGQSAMMTQFLADTIPIEELPVPIRYAMAMTAGNMMALTSGEINVGIMDLTEPDFPELGEQGEEHIYRKMKRIVTMLYKEIQRRDKSVPKD